MMPRTTLAMGLLVAFTSTGIVQATQAIQETAGEAARGPADNPTPQVRIVSPKDLSVLKRGTIHVKIETKDFNFAYDKATTPGTMTTLPAKYGALPQVPNSGHVHVYLAPYPRGEGVTPAKFFMVKTFKMPNQAEFTIDDVAPGKYRLLVDLANHDHTTRNKHHPTDWPPFDLVTITVK
jgi:hypothetical protein